MIRPPHPGETIKEDYLVPLGMSVNGLAGALGIGAASLNEIVRGKRGITADTALRLARCFGTSAEFWLNLQALYDLRGDGAKSRRQDQAGGQAAKGRMTRMGFAPRARSSSEPSHHAQARPALGARCCGTGQGI